MNVDVPTAPLGGPDADAVVLRLPATNAAPGLARAAVSDQWDQLPPLILDDVLLIVSELVTNAVRHGQPEIEMRLRIEPLAVDVSVLDHGVQLPPDGPLPVARTAPSGRGLAIVGKLANRWGIDPLPDASGKRVWATLLTDEAGDATITAVPIVAEPTTAEPTTAEPTTVEPITAEITSAEPPQ